MQQHKHASAPWPSLSGTDLRIVREPLRWKLEGAQRTTPERVLEEPAKDSIRTYEVRVEGDEIQVRTP